MSIHASQILDYLDTHPVSRYEGDFDSLLEMLHYIYTTCNPIDSRQIRQNFQQVDEILKKLTFEEADDINRIVCDLCYEFEQNAFICGLTAGMHLMTEINALM